MLDGIFKMLKRELVIPQGKLVLLHALVGGNLI